MVTSGKFALSNEKSQRAVMFLLTRCLPTTSIIIVIERIYRYQFKYNYLFFFSFLESTLNLQYFEKNETHR